MLLYGKNYFTCPVEGIWSVGGTSNNLLCQMSSLNFEYVINTIIVIIIIIIIIIIINNNNIIIIITIIINFSSHSVILFIIYIHLFRLQLTMDDVSSETHYEKLF